MQLPQRENVLITKLVFGEKSRANSPAFPDPESCGWLIENHVLHVMWVSGLAAPEVVLNFTACNCRKEYTMSLCQCMKK